MGKLEDVYREFIAANNIADYEERKAELKKFFDRLNHMKLPEYFNWVHEVFEGIHVRERGDKKALLWHDLETDESRSFTYKEIIENCNKLLNFLRDTGIEKGDGVYMMLPAIPETWFSIFASLKGGFVAVPTATTMVPKELEYRFSVYEPKAVIADERSAKIIDEALENSKHDPVKIVTGDVEGWTSYDEIKKEKSQAEPEKVRSNDIVFNFFTSGTTGLPKMVGHTAVSYPLGHVSTAYLIGITTDDLHTNLSAPGWAKFAWSSFFAPFIMGATVLGINYNRFIPDRYLEVISDYDISTFCAPPTAWRIFMLQKLENYEFNRLREVMSAGEPLNPEIINTWKKYTGTTIRDFYGQTESTAMIGNPPWIEEVIPGSFGFPSYMHDVALVDDDGNFITEPNVVGHIVVRLDRWRPIGLFAGYIGDEEKTRSVFRNNLYYTGDKAYFDERGYWWFVGRADDVIKTSDYRVGPFEVESALIEHDAVAEAAVVGSPDRIRWQVVKAFVVLKPEYEPSRELALELFVHCSKVLAKYKVPRIIEFVPELPKTISGKIKRNELRKVEEERRSKGERGEHEYFYSDFEELKKK